MRTGGREERRQEAIMEEDGGREESRWNVKTERDCGREEEAIFTLILTLILATTTEDPSTRAVLQTSPEVDRTAAEGDTIWLRGNASVELDVLLCFVCSYLLYNVTFRPLLSSQMVAVSCTGDITRPRTERREEED